MEEMQRTNVVDEACLVQAETLILSPVGAGLPIRHAQQAASLIPNATLMCPPRVPRSCMPPDAVHRKA